MKKVEETKKYTVVLPAALASKAAAAYGGNLTEAIRQSLNESLTRKSGLEFLKMRGKIKFDMTWQELKNLGEK
jgi:hypothetical protein